MKRKVHPKPSAVEKNARGKARRARRKEKLMGLVEKRMKNLKGQVRILQEIAGIQDKEIQALKAPKPTDEE